MHQSKSLCVLLCYWNCSFENPSFSQKLSRIHSKSHSSHLLRILVGNSSPLSYHCKNKRRSILGTLRALPRRKRITHMFLIFLQGVINQNNIHWCLSLVPIFSFALPIHACFSFVIISFIFLVYFTFHPTNQLTFYFGTLLASKGI